MVKNKKKEI